MKNQNLAYATDVEADKKAIRKVLQILEDSTNDGDWDASISIWAEDGVQMPAGAPTNQGVAQITEWLQPSYEQMDYDVKITSVDEVSVFGDIGLTRCSYEMSATPKDGGEKIILEKDAKALTLYKRQPDGSWKIAYDMMNSNIPPDSTSE